MTFDPSKVEMTPVDELPEKKDSKGKTVKKTTEKPKKKPTYSKSRYGRLAPVKVMNRGITDTINSTVLKNKKKKLAKDECEIGEAVMFMVEYYTAIDINHPALVMMSAIMGVTFTVMQLAGEEEVGKVQTKTKDSETDVNEVAK